MKPLPLILSTCVLSLLGGAVASTLLAGRGAQADGGPSAADIARLGAAVEDLRRGQLALREALDRASLGAALPSGAGAMSLGEIDAAVARALEQREAELGARAAADDAAAAAAAADADALDVDEAVARLLDPELGDMERELLWKRVRELGLLDDVVAVFEARVRANPNDPQLQVDLGKAYLQKIFEEGSGPLAGVWATRADQAFDAALALDPQDWQARFTKAVSLSFWPPIFGKQTEAISHFETLIAQQQGQASQPQFAQTYLWLGNLYAQSGKPDLAQATWAAGLQAFPDDADLQDKAPPN